VLDDLVNERLVRVEEHRGALRIELAHDVLIQPVTRSREKRLQQEALEKAREQDRLALAETQKESRMRRLRRLAVAGTVMALILATSLGFSMKQWQKADASAKTAKKETARAEDEKARADASAETAKKEKVRAEEEKVRADAKAKELAILTNSFISDCKGTSEFFDSAAGETRGSSKEVANVLSQIYEMLAVKCANQAKELHKLDPNNIRLTQYLGLVHLQIAKSAVERKDNKAAREECGEAIKMAGWLQDTPGGGYKSQMAVAKTYGLAGFFFDYLKEPSGDQVLQRGIQVLAIVQERQGTDTFDDEDWHDAAQIYYYRAATLREVKDSPSVVDFYQRSFQAEARAYGMKPRMTYLRGEMERAVNLGDKQKELQHAELAQEWYEKARGLADQQIAGESRVPATRAQLQELATAYSDAREISDKLKDWKAVVDIVKHEIGVYLELRNKTPDKSLQGDLPLLLAQAYGRLAWYELLAGRFEDSLEHARTGLELQPEETWIRVNEAHALLFTGHVAEAQETYLSLKDVSYNDRKLVKDVQDDLRQLCEMNYPRREMADIAQRLGINDPQLNSCLATSAVPR